MPGLCPIPASPQPGPRASALPGLQATAARNVVDAIAKCPCDSPIDQGGLRRPEPTGRACIQALAKLAACHTDAV